MSHPLPQQVTDLVEHELETAATEVERMTAGKPARSERLVARQQAQAKYSRFEAEVRAAELVAHVALIDVLQSVFLVPV